MPFKNIYLQQFRTHKFKLIEDPLQKSRCSIFLIGTLAMQKTDSGMIFLIHFTLTLYRDLHIMSNKSLGRWTTHKSRRSTRVIYLFSPGESKFGIDSGRFGNPKPPDEKKTSAKMQTILVYHDAVCPRL